MVTKSSVEHMSELKIRIETDEWVYEEYVEAWLFLPTARIGILFH